VTDRELLTILDRVAYGARITPALEGAAGGPAAGRRSLPLVETR
jgi:hypothetical protein